LGVDGIDEPLQTLEVCGTEKKIHVIAKVKLGIIPLRRMNKIKYLM
jgi:hypothetical protein